MVDVVDSDVRRQPTERCREVVERTAFNSLTMEVPIVMAVPLSFLELMLHIEQPYTDCRGTEGCRNLYSSKCPGTRDDGRYDDQADYGGIGGHHADPTVLDVSQQLDRHTLLQQEHIRGTESEQHQRIAVKPIQHPAPGGKVPVLRHRQGVDVDHVYPCAAVLDGYGVVRG